MKKKPTKSKDKCEKCNRYMPLDWYPRYVGQLICPICYTKQQVYNLIGESTTL